MKMNADTNRVLMSDVLKDRLPQLEDDGRSGKGSETPSRSRRCNFCGGEVGKGKSFICRDCATRALATWALATWGRRRKCSGVSVGRRRRRS